MISGQLTVGISDQLAIRISDQQTVIEDHKRSDISQQISDRAQGEVNRWGRSEEIAEIKDQ